MCRMTLLGTGLSLPGAPLSTPDLLELLSQTFGVSTRLARGIAKKLGVASRHHSRDWAERFDRPKSGARNPELAAAALAAAMAEAATPASALQYLLGHTATPARLLPPNISEVADRLGVAAPYAELRQANTGFANALIMASGLLSSPDAAPVAIVGSEVGTVFCDPMALPLDPSQWINTMQMGDGAAAVIVGPDDGSGAPILESAFYGHIGLGRSPGFTLDEGGSDYPAVREGRAMATFHCYFERVKEDRPKLYKAALAAAKAVGIEIDDIRIIVPYQAHGYSCRDLARGMNLPPSRFYGNGERFGNLGNAAMWADLHELRSSGLLKAGDRVLFISVEATHYMYGGFVYVHA